MSQDRLSIIAAVVVPVAAAMIGGARAVYLQWASFGLGQRVYALRSATCSPDVAAGLARDQPDALCSRLQVCTERQTREHLTVRTMADADGPRLDLSFVADLAAMALSFDFHDVPPQCAA